MTYPKIDYSSRDIEVIRLAVSKRLSGRLCAENVHPNIIRDEFGDLAIELVARIYSEEVGRVDCRWPRTWWDAIKIRFAPAWFLKRHPAEYETRSLVASALYPTMPVMGHQPTIKVFTQPRQCLSAHKP